MPTAADYAMGFPGEQSAREIDTSALPHPPMQSGPLRARGPVPTMLGQPSQPPNSPVAGRSMSSRSVDVSRTRGAGFILALVVLLALVLALLWWLLG
jgi:hypothetical protein